MSFDYVYDLFVSSCMENNLVFNTVDILNFSNSCNIKPDVKSLKNKIKLTNFKNYNQFKPFLGPVVFCPENLQLKNIKYNLSKIMLDLKLDSQNINPKDKMNKIINYINYLG